MVYCIRKTNLSKWHNKEVVKQKIELLKEVGTGDSNKCFNRIINKVSELQKEITNGEKV